MPVKNNGPGMTGRSSMTKKSKIEPEYPQWAESKMRAIENRRLKELQKIVRESMPEILAIAAEEQKTGSDSIAKGKINGRKTVADQRRQVFNADSANAAVRNVGKKNDPDAARDRMIQRHAGEKED